MMTFQKNFWENNYDILEFFLPLPGKIMKTYNGDDDLQNFFSPKNLYVFLVISMMIMTCDATATVKMVMITISTEGALKRHMTYDIHPIHPYQSHPYIALETTSHELI